MAELISAFARPSAETDGLPSARFEFMGVDCVLTIDPDLNLEVRKAGAKPSAKPIASGLARMQAVEAGSKKPDLVGAFRTAKKTVFELAGWLQKDEVTGDVYMSLKIQPHVQRSGWFPSQPIPRRAGPVDEPCVPRDEVVPE